MKNTVLHFGLALLLSMACISAKGGTMESSSVAGNDTYEIILVANPDNCGDVFGAGLYSYGETITIQATAAAPCCVFVGWTEDDVEVSADAEYTFEVTRDRTLVANFVIEEYEVIIMSNPEYGGGVIYGSGIYPCGSEITISAVPNLGCEFINWTTEDGTVFSTDAHCSFVVTGNLTLIAHFDCDVSIETIEIDGINIYPNPTKDEFKVSSLRFKVLNVEIFDMMGRSVGTNLCVRPETRNPKSETIINISELPTGIYFIRIQTENGVITRQIIKN